MAVGGMCVILSQIKAASVVCHTVGWMWLIDLLLLHDCWTVRFLRIINTGLRDVLGGKKTTYTPEWADKQEDAYRTWKTQYYPSYAAGVLPPNDPLFGTAAQV